MQIASIMAGFDMAQADDLRKAMGKKIPEEMARNIRKRRSVLQSEFSN